MQQRRLHLIVPALLRLLGLALRVADPPVLADLRVKLFDFFQTLKPREEDRMRRQQPVP